MVSFEQTMGGFRVLVDGKPFGHLQRGTGFFTDSTVVREFTAVCRNDLERIARKADEVERHGNVIPTCPACKGTPNFPGRVFTGERMATCREEIHRYA